MRRIVLAVLLTLVGFRPGAGADMSVSGLVKAPGGQAVLGARVDLLSQLSNFEQNRRILVGLGLPEPEATVRTDASGRFLLKVPRAGMWQVVIEAPGRVPMRFFPLPLVESMELPTVVLPSDASSSIVVLEVSGRPAARVWVVARSASAESWSAFAKEGWQTGPRWGRTGDDGRIGLPRIADERLLVHVFRSAGARATLAVGDDPASIILDMSGVRRRLIEARNEAGDPLAGLVAVTGSPAWPLGFTDSEGRLEWSDNTDESSRLILFASDGPRGIVELPGNRRAGPDQIVVPARRWLAGRVLQARSQQSVVAALIWPGSDPGRGQLTDDRGAFEMVAPQGDRFWLQAHAPGSLPQARWVEPEESGLSLHLRGATRVVGGVVDVSGTTLAGVRIEAARLKPTPRLPSFHPDPLESRSVTDSQGRFTLGGLQPQGRYQVTASLDGFKTSLGVLSRPGDRSEEPLRIVLEKARFAFGLVRDEDGKAIGDVEIEVLAAASARPSYEEHRRRSDASGRFEFAELPMPPLRLEARKEGYAPLTVRGIDFAPGVGPIDLGILVLGPGAALEGRVIDPQSQPLDEVSVRVAEIRGASSKSQTRRVSLEAVVTSTGRDGRFRVEGLRPGQAHHLVFDRAGFRPTSIRGVETPRVEAPRGEPLEVVLEPAASVSGRVLDSDGEPVGGALLSLHGRQRRAGHLEVRRYRQRDARSAVADELGRFVIEDVVPGEVELEAVARDFQPSAPLALSVVAGDSIAGLTLRLERGVVLEGRVTNAHGEAVSEVQVRLGHASTKTDVEGFYRLTGIARGSRSLRVAHRDYESLTLSVEIEAGTNTADVVLAGGWPVSGYVVDQDTVPVDGARVTLRARGRGSPRKYQATARDDGLFRFHAVVRGVYDITIERLGYASKELRNGLEMTGEPIENVEFRIARGASIIGRILGLDFDGVTAVEVRARRQNNTKTGWVDYEGRYEIRDLGPGDWLVEARLRGGSRQVEARVSVASDEREVMRDLEFGSGFTLTGRVIHAGDPVEGASVSLRAYELAVRRSVTSDYRGAFLIADLPAGRYRIDVSNHQELLLYNEDLDLESDREMVIEISTVQVSGSVSSAETAEPIGAARVSIQKSLEGLGAHPGSLITVGTDMSGAFSLARLSAGSYRLRVQKDGFVPVEKMLLVEPGADLDGLKIALQPTDGLDLVVHLASGLPPPSARVTILDEAGQPLHSEARFLNKEGRALFASVPAGVWDLLVDAPQGATRRLFGIAVPGDGLVVMLAEAVRIEVRVPALVASNQVGSLSVVDERGMPFQMIAPDGIYRQHWTLTGGVGVLEGVPVGHWTLRAAASDGRIWERTIVTSAGQREQMVSLD